MSNLLLQSQQLDTVKVIITLIIGDFLNLLGLSSSIMVYMGSGALPLSSNLIVRYFTLFYDYAWEPIYCVLYTVLDTFLLVLVLTRNFPSIYQADFIRFGGNVGTILNLIIESLSYVGILVT